MTDLPGSPAFPDHEVLRLGSIDEYTRHSAVMTDSSPIPVLGRRWAGKDPFLPELQTAKTSVPWAGSVMACSPSLAPIARVLAVRSGRPLYTGSLMEALDRSLTEEVAAVVSLDEVTPAVLAAIGRSSKLGLVTGRSFETVSALAARTLIYGPGAILNRHDLSFDALSDESSTSDRLAGAHATPRRLHSALAGGVAFLTGSGHGRDCLMHMDGGGICGRMEDIPLLQIQPPISQAQFNHPTSCQQGGGCWRNDVSMDDHLRAADIDASFVLLDSCRTAVASDGAVRSDVSIPLSLLEGSALSAVSAAGTRGGSPASGHLFKWLVRAGLSVGAAVYEVNDAISAERDGLGKLVLFGDPGLVPGAANKIEEIVVDSSVPARIFSVPGVTLARGKSVIAEAGSRLLVLPRTTQDTFWILPALDGSIGGGVVESVPSTGAHWSNVLSPLLRRLSDLTHLGLDVPAHDIVELRQRALGALRGQFQAKFDNEMETAVSEYHQVVTDTLSIQQQIVADEVELIRTSFYNFVDGWPEPWDVSTVEERMSCPQCLDLTAIKYGIRPDSGLTNRLQYEVCTRCGEVLSGAETIRCTISASVPSEVKRGGGFSVSLELTATAEESVSVSVGIAMTNESTFGCVLSGVRSVTLHPGQSATMSFHGTTNEIDTTGDLQPVKILAAVDGSLQCITRSVWMRS